MLKIIIELHPFGYAEKKQTIATMDLWNDGSGTPEKGNYQGSSEIAASPWNQHIQVSGGRVIGHPRTLPVWSLVAKMLKQMGYGNEA